MSATDLAHAGVLLLLLAGDVAAGRLAPGGAADRLNRTSAPFSISSAMPDHLITRRPAGAEMTRDHSGSGGTVTREAAIADSYANRL